MARHTQNPRANRAHVFGLLEYARATGGIEAFRTAQAGVESIGPGSKHSPRVLFERTLANVALGMVDAAMQDPDTATIVSLGREVLASRLFPTTFTTGTHHLMAHSLHDANATGFNNESPYNGRVAAIKLWRASDGALVEIPPLLTRIHIAQFERGVRVRGGTVPLLIETIAERPFDTREIAIKGVDAVGVRLLPDEARNMLASLAAEITDGEYASGPLAPAPEVYPTRRAMLTINLPGD